MSICIIGLGRLGGPFAACWAKKGFSVIGVDKNEEILDKLRNREATAPEAGMQEILSQEIDLSVTNNIVESVQSSDFIFVLVSTPSTTSGRFSEANVINVCKEVGKGLKARENKKRPIVIIASTVSPQAIDNTIIPVLEESSGLKCIEDFGVCHIPEWVALGELIHGFLNPDITLIGESDKEAGQVMEDLYKKFLDNEPPIIHTTLLNAEISKVCLNAYIATKITFANTIAQVCERLPGADADVVTSTIGLDKRIGTKFFKGAVAYGGPCLKPNTIVQTENGPKKIKEIKIGDKVFSHDGKLHNVSEVLSRDYEGEIIEVTPAGFSKTPVIATPEHPVWVSRKITANNKTYRTISTTGKMRLCERKGRSAEEFVPISNIEIGDMISIPSIIPKESNDNFVNLKTHHKSPVKAKTLITPDIFRIFGLYLAEGSTWNKEIKFSLHKKETYYVDDIDAVISECFGVSTKVKSKKGNGIHTRTTCNSLAFYLRKTFGKKSHKKCIPPEWLGLPEEHLKELIKGIWYGDGSDSDNKYTLGITSFNIFNFMKLAFLRLGIAFTTKIYEPRIDKNGVKHRKAYHIIVANEPYVTMLNNIFEGRMHVVTKGKGKKTIWFEKGKMLAPVKKIAKKHYKGKVYNLEVDEADSYMLESSVVHNCFPRDIKAMKALLDEVEESAFLPMAVHEMNKRRTQALAKLINRQSVGKVVGILGLTFKPNTAVVEDSPSVWVINELRDRCQMMCAYDPEGKVDIVPQYESAEDCIKHSSTVVIMTPWNEFKEIDYSLLSGKKVIDCWRILDESKLPEDAVYIPLGKHSGA